MPLISPQPIRRIAIVRFSALGDLVLALPVVHALRAKFPEAEITWITSPLGFKLLEGLPGVRFEVFEKPRTFREYRNFYRAFREKSFDAVLALQANLRINLLYPALHAPIKLGFDRTRAREGQWLFCNSAIPYADEHLADSFLSFAAELGADKSQVRWELPLDEADRGWAREQVALLPRPLIAIHPCASKTERNWLLIRYQQLVEMAQQRWQCSFIFTGGSARLEREYCAQLAAVASNGIDMSGRTTPKQLAALLAEADVLVAPDTAAIHLACAMETPVVGLYAVAPPRLSGPHHSMDFVVDRYPEAVRRFLGRHQDELAWNTRVHHPEAMSLIEVDEVLYQIGRALKQ